MSIAEIQRFAADVSSNATLRAEAEKAFLQASQVDSVSAFAAAKGYGFTASELQDQIEAKSKADGKTITDGELDTVSGGFGSGFGFFMAMMLLPMYMPSGNSSSSSSSSSS